MQDRHKWKSSESDISNHENRHQKEHYFKKYFNKNSTKSGK